MQTDISKAISTLKNKGWEVQEFNDAFDAAHRYFEGELLELCEVLEETVVNLERDIIASGGGRTKFVQELAGKFNKKKWKKDNIQVTNKIEFNQKINAKVTKASSHEVDHLIIAEGEKLAILEIEWNNKSEFFDRDIHNILSSWEAHAVELGIIVTRGEKLNESLKEDIYKYFKDSGIESYEGFEMVKDKLKDKDLSFTFPSQSHKSKINRAIESNQNFTTVASDTFWTSKYRDTTSVTQLNKRIERGQLGRAPLIVFGIPHIIK